MSRTRTPRPLGEVLNGMIEHLGLRKGLNEARVIEAWASLAGAELNAVTDSAWMKGRKLFVKITSSTVRHDLHLNRTEWKQRLNEALGEKLVDEIVFR